MMHLDYKRLLSTHATSIIVVAGCALRLYHYLRNPSVWHDEAALIVNVLDQSFLQLLGPLRWNEAGPPLFLWAERALALLLGDSTYALRLLPLLASCAGLTLFAAAVRRILSSSAVPWAVLLFACSDRLLWHACEAKPYALDVFFAAAVLFTMSRIRDWPLDGQLWLWALLSPVMIFASFPACFVIGGLFLFYLPLVRRNATWQQRALYTLWSGIVVICFSVLYFGPIQAQRNSSMEECWTLHFPNWGRPWTLPIWSVASTAEVFRYCFLPVGNLLFPFALIGAFAFWRSEQRRWITLLAGPLALAWVAACLHGYPYGGSRLEIFALPGLAVLIAAGAEKALLWLQARWSLGRNLVYVCLLVPIGAGLVSIALPWPRADVAAAANYIQFHREPDDCIRANHWEYVYYFHKSGECDEILSDQEPATANRVWLAITTPEAVNRQALLQPWLQNWTVREEREFKWTSVWLLERQATPVTPVPPAATGGQ
ncbi:MAG TPA: glycosyltransferase family 39 protein [Gemmataceae bacterium]|nr:glycosyltransferase family 39 protein [Gemmataceae bacterium]